MSKIYDMIVIGGGPAGLTAGLYGGRAKLDVLVIEKKIAGGQITVTSEVVNFPGIPETNGIKFGETLKKQAENFGVEFLLDEVVSFELDKDIKTIKTTQGEYKALSVVIATGASPRKLGFVGEKEYEGRGVAYCATCDGEFFTGMNVFVIGAGFAAAEESIFLTKYAKKVTVIAREPEFTCAKSIADKVLAHPKIQVKFNTELLEVSGDIKLRKAKFKNNKTNEVFEYTSDSNESFGVFVFVGYEPQSKLFKEQIKTDSSGFIVTDDDFMTNITGVYAAGDIRPKKLRQLVTAVSDGAQTAFNIEKYSHQMREKLGIVKEEKVKEKVSDVSNQKIEYLDSSLKEQLKSIVDIFENKVKLVVIKDGENSKSQEMEDMIKEISGVSDKLEFITYNVGENEQLEKSINIDRVPTIAILDKDNNFTGLKYSTLPNGHELNSFILAMYNVAGPGQKISQELVDRISKLDKYTEIKIGISLNCTKCPDTVQSAQRIATLNSNIQVEVIDVFSFTDFKEKYDIMSVPALVLNDKLYFGSKSIEEVIDIIEKA